MKTTSILLFLIFLLSAAHAQEPCKSYANISDLLNGVYETTLNVTVEKRTKNQIFMSGGGDYKISNGDKEADKRIKSELFAIEVNDSLYVNLKGLKYKKRAIGGWFAPALICKGNIYFSALPVGPSAAAAFGLIGGAVQAANANVTRVYYVVDSSGKKLKLDKIGSEKIEEMLGNYPELLERYKKEAFKDHIEIIEKYLRLVNLQNS